jgi:hypothetical protein
MYAYFLINIVLYSKPFYFKLISLHWLLFNYLLYIHTRFLYILLHACLLNLLAYLITYIYTYTANLLTL